MSKPCLRYAAGVGCIGVMFATLRRGLASIADTGILNLQVTHNFWTAVVPLSEESTPLTCPARPTPRLAPCPPTPHTHCHRSQEERRFYSCLCSQNPCPVPFPDSLGPSGLKMEKCSQTWSQALAYSSLSGFKGSGTERANAWFGGLSSIMANTVNGSCIHPSAKANFRISSRQHPCSTVIDWNWMGRGSPFTILCPEGYWSWDYSSESVMLWV